mmetsp:Transcript_27808/g.44234  ORF Transcript_27808/g.44234 Transcript_27808/m.44234 type:complete len:81 (-) Transcript_27808:82-324(-)
MRRVLKPGGTALFLENARSSNNLLGSYQDLTATTVAKFGGKACLYNQDISKLVREAGLSIVREQSYANGLIKSVIATKSA